MTKSGQTKICSAKNGSCADLPKIEADDFANNKRIADMLQAKVFPHNE